MVFKLFQNYQKALATKPILTNMISTGILFGVGDGLAQVLFPAQSITLHNENETKKKSELNHDYIRTFRAVFYGGIIFAPVGSYWYRYVAKLKYPFKINNNNSKKQFILNTLTRVGFDQLLFSPIGVAMYYTVMSLIEFKSFEELKERLYENYKITLITNWKVWPVFQVFNFTVVPLEFRLMATNVISIFWNCFLSYRNNKKLEIEKVPIHSPPLPE